MANNNPNQKPNFHHHQNQNNNINNNNQTGLNFDIQNLLKPSLSSGPTFLVPTNPPSSPSQYPIASSSSFPPATQPSPRPIAGDGARIMAAAPASDSQSPARIPSRKVPRGRHLIGDRTVYDVDVRLFGEAQPQLEVTPITRYVSDPTLLRGRQVAVNRSYICYGLKPGPLRVIDINTALRALLRGHTQRVTDMAFFAEDVPLLASASVDGQVFIWKIVEGKDKENKPQISGDIVLAIQFEGAGKFVHPRLCWHPHKQEILMVSIGNCILKVDTLRLGRGRKNLSQFPIQCGIVKPIDGIVLAGTHDGEITELSMCQWMISRLASASTDGVVKIWTERKASPLAIFQPHDGRPVNSVTFITAPNRPDHILLLTAGPQNREVKLWTSSSEEGWLLPSDADSWQCTQTLEIVSSAEPKLEEAFFNQVVALPRAGIILLANAKKNAIYAVHIEYGPDPASTRMNYIAEFTVTMPILSLTGTSEGLADGQHVVQVYCVQTQAIQQYALDLALCLPPPIENVESEKLNFTSSIPINVADGTAMLEPSRDRKPSEIAAVPITHAPHTIPESSSSTSRLPKVPSDTTNPTEVSTSVVDLPNSNETSITPYGQGGGQPVINHSGRRDSKPAAALKHPAHLITPAEILSTTILPSDASSSDAKTPDFTINNDTSSIEAQFENYRGAGPRGNDDDHHREPQVVAQKRAFYSQASNVTFGKYDIAEVQGNASNSSGGEVQDMTNDVSLKADESEILLRTSVQATKGKKQKGKNSQPSCPSSSSLSPFNSMDSANEPDGSFDSTKLSTMKAMLDQLIAAQQELQKQMDTLVSVPVAKEARRLEGSLNRSMEKIVKTNSDALWARFQEENIKQEKLEQDRLQQLTNLVTNCISRDLPTVLEKSVKKDIAAMGPVIARSMTQIMEKSVSAAITESFQKGIGEKTVAHLEKSVNSKIEATLARHVQLQFQTSGKQALQDALKSSLEASIIPAFEVSCKNMFEQVDATFRKGFVEHSSAAQQQFESTHSSLAVALREAINSASTVTRTLSGELADGQRRLLAFAAAGATSKAGAPLSSQLSNGALPSLQEKAEPPVDPIKEISRLISERKYEEAFTAALQKSDVSIVSWLCSQVDLQGILSIVPLPLSQGVLLALLQQLSCDISNDTNRKLEWMTEVAVAINPADQLISVHARSIFEQVYQMLGRQQNLPGNSAADATSIRLLMHVINSVLMSCK